MTGKITCPFETNSYKHGIMLTHGLDAAVLRWTHNYNHLDLISGSTSWINRFSHRFMQDTGVSLCYCNSTNYNNNHF